MKMVESIKSNVMDE